MRHLEHSQRYHVPSNWEGMIDVIGPSVRFPSSSIVMKARKHTAGGLPSAGSTAWAAPLLQPSTAHRPLLSASDLSIPSAIPKRRRRGASL